MQLASSPRTVAAWCAGVAMFAILVVAGLIFTLSGWFKPAPTTVQSTGPAPLAARVAVPNPKVRFTDVTAKAGIRFTHNNGFSGKRLLPETMGSGVAVIDFDNDGFPDLLFINGRPWPGMEK